jgi:hypothetical protein
LNSGEREYIAKAAQTISAEFDRMRRDLTIWVRWSGLLQATYKLGSDGYRPPVFAEIERSIVTPDEWQAICHMARGEERICMLHEIGKAPLIGTFEPSMEIKGWGPTFISEAFRFARDVDRLSTLQPQDLPWPCSDGQIKSVTAFEDWTRLYQMWARPTREMLVRLERIAQVHRLRGGREFLLDEYVEETARKLKGNFMMTVHGYQYPGVDFVGFGESGLNFSLQFFVDDLVGDHFERLSGVFSEIGMEIKARFDAEHIEIPLPQWDVWLRKPDF